MEGFPGQPAEHPKWREMVSNIEKCKEYATACDNATVIIDETLKLAIRPRGPIRFEINAGLGRQTSAGETTEPFEVVEGRMHIKNEGLEVEPPLMVASRISSNGEELTNYFFNPYEHEIEPIEVSKPKSPARPASGIKISASRGRLLFFLY